MANKIGSFFGNIRKAISFNGMSAPEKYGSGYFYPQIFGIGLNRTIRETITSDGQRKAYQYCPVVTSVMSKKINASANGKFYFVDRNGKEVDNASTKELLKLFDKMDANLAYLMNQVFGKCYIHKAKAIGFTGITSLKVLYNWNIVDDITKDYVEYTDEASRIKSKIYRTDLIVWSDNNYDFTGGKKSITGGSRLISLSDPVSNIAAIYEGLNSIWTNGGAMGVLSPKSSNNATIPLDPKEKSDLSEHYARKFGGQREKTPVMVTNQAMSWQSTILPVSDLQYIEGGFENTRAICVAYGIDTIMLGFSEGTTFANKDAAERDMYQNAVIPEQDGFCAVINSDKDISIAGLELKKDFSGVAILQDDEGKKAETDAKIMAIAKIMKDTLLYTDDQIRSYIEENSKLNLPFKKN